MTFPPLFQIDVRMPRLGWVLLLWVLFLFLVLFLGCSVKRLHIYLDTPRQ